MWVRLRQEVQVVLLHGPKAMTRLPDGREIDVGAIRARDRDYNDIFEEQKHMPANIAHRLVAWPVSDRRDLLALVDALRAERDEARTEAGAWEATAQHHYKEARALEKRLAEAERDAVRYRWLRDNKFSGPGVWVDSDDGIRHFIGEQADRTVDAAMEGGK